MASYATADYEGPVEADRDASPVDTALGQLQSVLDDARVSLGRLGSRLAPVLAPSEPQPEGMAMLKSSGDLAPLTARLHMLTDEVSDLKSEINILVNRLSI